ncbi:hypothetical protein LS482_02420 [Sinomicrobium kalidii]|nr:hypothetical protein [Sinomicrobium kalidii]UGU16735.1 hypothetical protein LS482_02420 [Sinomicrobium kalidii]
MNKIAFSVIISTYNAESWLAIMTNILKTLKRSLSMTFFGKNTIFAQ